MKWINIEDELPKIPKGKHGVSVIVASFDSCYEEINPGCGWDIEQCTYAYTKDKKGNPVSEFLDGRTDDACFQQIYYGGDGGTSWGPMGDPVYFWMYSYSLKEGLPSLPEGAKESNDER